MILFVFEGANREVSIFKTLEFLYFSNKMETRIYSYNNNIYNLYKEMTKSDFDEDIVSVLKNKLLSDSNNELTEIKRRSDFSEIFLFFDYDGHNNRENIISDMQIKEMLEFFNDETSDYGKLYINYPMVESIYYTRNKLPDENYYTYTSEIALGKKFKQKVNAESYYKNLDLITFKINRKTQNAKIPKDKNHIEEVKQNWQYLKDMNIKKANYICNCSKEYPVNMSDISQKKIFENQLIKYIQLNSEVAILNSFPLFIYEYYVT